MCCPFYTVPSNSAHYEHRRKFTYAEPILGFDLLCHAPSDTLSMSNDALLWNSPQPPPRKPQPGERLWSLHKDGKPQVHAELRVLRDSAVECQFWYEGELVSGRLWTRRADAVAHADNKRRELERRGWTTVPRLD
jgi:hypothetical protein